MEYPEVGVYHPQLPSRLSDSARSLPDRGDQGTVGVLLLRSYLLAGNCGHYNGVIAALEARGLRVIPVFAATSGVRCVLVKVRISRPVVEGTFTSAVVVLFAEDQARFSILTAGSDAATLACPWNDKWYTPLQSG